MAIKKATIADVHELITLVNSAYRGEDSRQGWTTEADILDGARTDRDMLIEQINTKDAAIIIYTDETTNQIIGSIYQEVKGNKLYVGMLSVSPLAQGKGIGTLLLDFAAAYGREHNCNVLTGTIIGGRAELMNWYSRYGFRYTGNTFPFPSEKRFGIPKRPLELLEIEKDIILY